MQKKIRPYFIWFNKENKLVHSADRIILGDLDFFSDLSGILLLNIEESSSNSRGQPDIYRSAFLRLTHLFKNIVSSKTCKDPTISKKSKHNLLKTSVTCQTYFPTTIKAIYCHQVRQQNKTR